MVLLTAEKNPFTRDSLQGPSSQNYKKLFKNTKKKTKKKTYETWFQTFSHNF